MRSDSVRHTFFVPARTSKAGTLALQTGRLLTGERVGLAFTSEASLLLTLGPSQQWIRLDGGALKDMLAPLGVEHVRVDPRPAGELATGGPMREWGNAGGEITHLAVSDDSPLTGRSAGNSRLRRGASF
jgi:hypothetical protein